MTDRRKTVVFATLLADEQAGPLRQRGAEGLLGELLDGLDAEEQGSIERALDALLRRLRQTDPAGAPINPRSSESASRRDAHS